MTIKKSHKYNTIIWYCVYCKKNRKQEMKTVFSDNCMVYVRFYECLTCHTVEESQPCNTIIRGLETKDFAEKLITLEYNNQLTPDKILQSIHHFITDG